MPNQLEKRFHQAGQRVRAMVLSVNTNAGALIALQNLSETNRNLSQVQNRVNTGLRVATAKDNGAIFAIAQNLRAEVGGLRAVEQSLDRAISVSDVAIAGGQTIADILVEAKEKSVAATETGLSADTLTALNNDFQALIAQISTIVSNAIFDGANLLSAGASNLVALSDANGNNITVSAQDLSTGNLSLASADLTSQSNAQTALTNLDTAITTVSNALASFGAKARALESQRVFISKLSDTIKSGIGNLVDADLASESAALQSLQVKQQLGVQALAIANSSPRVVLSLFQ